jgi:hypothetical protein
MQAQPSTGQAHRLEMLLGIDQSTETQQFVISTVKALRREAVGSPF